MKTAKPSNVKIKKPAARSKVESSGHWIAGNIWLNVGLSKKEARMVKTLSEKMFTPKVNSAFVARHLMQVALAHFDVLEPLMLKVGHYQETEGFVNLDECFQGMIQQQHAKFLAGGAA